MDDLISRRQAIDVIDKEQKEIDVSDVSAMYAYSKCKTIIKQLPSAQHELSEEDRRLLKKLRSFHNGSYAKVIDRLMSAQPETGKWISADAIFGGVPFYCSECGENTRDTVMGKPRWKFCPMCGSRNEVTE